MTEAKVILAKLKDFFADLTAPAADPAVTAMGTMVNVDGGVPAYVDISDDGIAGIDVEDAVFSDEAMTTPYPDGTFTITETGATFTVVGGITTEATPGVDPAVTSGPDMNAQFAEFQTATNEKFANYENKFSAYEQRFADYEVKMAKANKVIEGLLSLTELLADAPMAKPDPAVTSAAAFSEDDKIKRLKNEASIIFKK